MDTGRGLRLRAPRASRNDDLAVETTVIFRVCFRGQRGFYLATDHRRRAQSINMRTAGWAAYVLSTVWFSVGDYCRVLLRFARLLPDHLRGCHAAEPPLYQNPILAADANVTDQARF